MAQMFLVVATSSSCVLTGGFFSVVLPIFDQTISFTLLKADVDAIKLIYTIARSTQSSYVTIDPSAIRDMFGNSVNLVLNGPATDFTPDTTPPYLVSYALDCNRANNTGELRLSFSESVNASTFDLTKLVFQDAALQTFKVRLATAGVDQIGVNHSNVISTTSSTEIFVWIMSQI